MTTITIVTPVLNMAATIDRTIESVVSQSGEFRVRYHIQDGGSTDGTIDRVREWQNLLQHGKFPTLNNGISFSYASEPDFGIYDAVRKGFSNNDRDDCEWLGWINADDILAPSAFALLRALDTESGIRERVNWVTGMAATEANGYQTAAQNRSLCSGIVKYGLADGTYWPTVQQEGTFFRAGLWSTIDDYHDFACFKYAGDWNLWRTLADRAELYQFEHPLGYFNVRPGQASQANWNAYQTELDNTVSRYRRGMHFLNIKPHLLRAKVIRAHWKNGELTVDEWGIKDQYDRSYEQNKECLAGAAAGGTGKGLNGQTLSPGTPPSAGRKRLDAIRAARDGQHREAEDLLQEVLAETNGMRARSRIREVRNVEKIGRLYRLDIAPWLKASESPKVDIEQYRKRPYIGVSLVTCSMNRTENLLRALPSWLQHDEAQEVVIVDWSSTEPVVDALRREGLDDARLKVVRMNDQPRWILSYAYNIGFRCASCEEILKADADIVLSPDFFRRNGLRKGSFIAGDYRKVEPGQEYINGFFYVHREHIMAVKGFNEYIITYGWDDDELYGRLEANGLERVCVDIGTISHLEHDDTARTGDASREPRDALEELRSHTYHYICRNRYIANAMPTWSEDHAWLPVKSRVSHDRYLELEQDAPHPHVPDPEVLAAADVAATRRLASFHFGDVVDDVSPDALYALLQTGQLNEVELHDWKFAEGADWPERREFAPRSSGRRCLVVHVQHGLGNRLRAMASAAVCARAAGRELVVVWEPDEHCACCLGDLFEYSGCVYDELPEWASTAARQISYMEDDADGVKDAFVDFNTSEDIYVKTAYVLNAPGRDYAGENEFLQGLEPVSEVAELVASVRADAEIGVHVRMQGGAGDDKTPFDSPKNWTKESHEIIQKWRDSSHYSRFLRRLNELDGGTGSAKIFLAADNAEAYGAFEAELGGRARFLPRELFDRSAMQIRYALADAILLSKCPRILGSHWSSFTELAIRLAPEDPAVEICGVDF